MVERISEETVKGYIINPYTEGFVKKMREISRERDFFFDPDTHVYSLDGKELLSVTTAMKPLTEKFYGSIDKEILNRAAELGTNVHEVIEWYIKEGILEYNENEKPYIDAYLAFEKAYCPNVLFSELKLFHPEEMYAGTCDIVAIIHGKVVLIDIKTTSEIHDAFVKVQLEAYKRMLVSLGLPIERKAILQLKKNGTYKLVWYEEQDPEAWDIFQSCLSVSRYLKENEREDKSKVFFFRRGDESRNYKGSTIPSVTSILTPLLPKDGPYLSDEESERAARIEKSVQESVFLYAEEKYMEAEKGLEGFTDAFMRFDQDKSPRYVFWDKEVMELRHLYGEKADLLAIIDGEAYLIYVTLSEVVPDYFSKVYLEAVARGFDFMNFKVKKNAVLRLKADGSYLLDVYDRDPIRDWTIFIDLLVIERYFRRHKAKSFSF